ncbi:MAG: DsbA family oxidoreductase [Balneolaceae bacterium]|nr:DsbA family oxidoreductase [Balneolaceae bacterium]
MSKLKNITPGKKTDTIFVDVWSDIVCPFCYIGKRNLENALEESGLTEFVKVVWHSFELAPDAQTNSGATIYEELGKRKGWSTEQSLQIHKQMEQRAKESGLDYDFDQTVPANSFKAHRLLHLAKNRNVQNEVKENLLKGYFTDGKNIDDEEYLIETGREAGLVDDEVRNALQSDTIEKEVREDIENARKLGIQGVPFFILNQKYALSGAQPVEVFVQALEKVKEEMGIQSLNSDDTAFCGPDGNC